MYRCFHRSSKNIFKYIRNFKVNGLGTIGSPAEGTDLISETQKYYPSSDETIPSKVHPEILCDRSSLS
jgi:hypothetical protein